MPFVKLAHKTEKELGEPCLSPWENRIKVTLETIKWPICSSSKEQGYTEPWGQSKPTFPWWADLFNGFLYPEVKESPFPLPQLHSLLPLGSPEKNNVSIVENFLPKSET